jgi:signal peptidase I
MKNQKIEKNKSLKNTLLDYVISIAAAFIIALTFRSYVFARADVDGESMMSTLYDKDVIFVEKISKLTHNFKKGQIVIFNSKNYNEDIYVKRVIATYGDEIEIKNGKVFLNGFELEEPYLDKNTVTNPGPFMTKNKKYKLKEDEIFVLGDNRENSVDSRILGPINIKDIEGHVIFRIYPFNEIKIFK